MSSPAEQAVQAINERFGRHDGYRVAHAKGVFCRGTFVAAPEAARLTRAAHMRGQEVPVTVRFSNGSGNPRAPDTALDARGMATKFHLSDGTQTDIVAITLPCFFVRTPEDFLAFTRASKPFLAGQPGPRFALFLATHREAWRATAAALRSKPPVSYATCAYNGIHAFGWTAADESERFVRYTWVPAAGEQALSANEVKGRGRDYLQEEVAERLAREPLRFTLRVQIAAPGDPTRDATEVWPDDRERVDVGALELSEVDTDSEQHGDLVVFDPVNVIDGIELSDDPLPRLRSQAYSISAERRSGAATGAQGG